MGPGPVRLTWAVHRLPPGLDGPVLRVDLPGEWRCVSSSLLGGGLGTARTWINLQVPSGYARMDPEAHLTEVVATVLAVPAPGGVIGMMTGPGGVIGMMTAASVERVVEAAAGSAQAFATVGLGHPIAAAGDPTRPPATAGARFGAPRVGTVNIFAVVSEPLTDAGLVGALLTVVEAKAQALAAAGIRARNAPGLATGTASDAVAVACPLPSGGPFGGSSGGQPASPFCGPATATGADLARAVYQAILRGSQSPGEETERRGGKE